MKEKFSRSLKWFQDHQDEYIRDLGDYVSYPSVSKKGEDGYPFGKGCHDMLIYMKNLMAKYGLEDTRLIDDVFAHGIIKGTGKQRKKIAIACHGDVVPPGEGWDKDPFKMYVKGDHLVGRGTTDNKGAGMAVLYAMRYLLESGFRPQNDIVLLVGSSEETGMDDVKLAGDDLGKYDITLVPDSGFPLVYGEKANGRASFSLDMKTEKLLAFRAENKVSVIDRAEAVILSDSRPKECDRITVEKIDEEKYRIVALGLGKHPSMPEGGLDASTLLAGYLVSSGLLASSESSVLERFSSLFRDFYGTGLSIAQEDEESGPVTAVLRSVELKDGRLDIVFGFKLPLSIRAEDAIEKLRKVIPDIVIGDDLTRGWKYPLDDMCYSLNDISNEVWQSDGKPHIMAGGTYARYIQPAVVYGMGSPHGNVKPPFPEGQGRAHQRNESVHLLRMQNGFIVYSEALQLLDRII